jgi:hypothetical protein
VLKTKCSGKYLYLRGMKSGQFRMLNKESVCDNICEDWDNEI